MPNPRYQTRLPEDDAERVDEYVDEHGVSQSEAVRRLIRRGLEAEEDASRSEASINRTVRLVGGVLIGLVALAIILAAAGVL